MALSVSSNLFSKADKSIFKLGSDKPIPIKWGIIIIENSLLGSFDLMNTSAPSKSSSILKEYSSVAKFDSKKALNFSTLSLI